MDIVDKLIEKQGTLSDREFARLLGVSHTSWTETKKRDSPVGMKILSAAMRRFPTLSDEVLREVAAYNSRRESAKAASA